MNDNTDTDTRSSGSVNSRTRRIGDVYYYTIDGKAFETVSSDEEAVIAITIGIKNKKEDKED